MPTHGWIAVFATVAALAIGAAPSHAAPTAISATLSFQGGALYDDVVIEENGFVADVSVTGGHQLASILFPGGFVEKPFGDSPSSFTLTRMGMSSTTYRDGFDVSFMNGAGTYMGGAATLPLLGLMKICLFVSCYTSPIGNVSVPMSVVGAGGTATGMGVAGVTVIGAPWTTGTAVLSTGETLMGSRHGAGSAMSQTANASGQLQLVTPVMIRTQADGHSYGFFAVLSMHFVPEPTTVALLGGGILALAIGRRKHARG